MSLAEGAWRRAGSVRRDLRARVRDSILLRPLAFVAGGLVLAWISLGLDRLLGPAFLPPGLRFPPGTGRLLLVTLAGATLTVAGITFWVRAASVQLAAAQYSPRVVHGFLQDWFQQSMMGLLVGFFAFMVSVLRVMPDVGAAADVDLGAVPHLSVLICILLAGGAVLVVLVAIRNSVRSMQPGDLARRITDLTLDQIRATHLPRRPADEPGDSALDAPPTGGVVIRSTESGWVQRIDVAALAGPFPSETIVRLEVRVGLFVGRGRQVCTVWSPEPVDASVQDRVRDAIALGRSRTIAQDIHYGIQQLGDVAIGSLAQGTADAASAHEVIVHLEIVLRELLLRDLPPSASEDEQGRRILRPREFTFPDYVAEAFDRLRLVAAPHPTVVVAIIESIGSLVDDVRAAGRRSGLTSLLRQGRLTLAACEAAGVLEEDLRSIRRAAVRRGIVAPEDVPAD